MNAVSLSDRLNPPELQDYPAIAQLLNRYFDTINNQDFEATAALFAAEGVLFPPFDAAMIGPEAIAAYLEAEAKGLQLFPLHYTVTCAQENLYECQVGGKVQTPVFTVNVCWDFQLNANYQIESVKVNLLASMEELLKLKT